MNIKEGKKGDRSRKYIQKLNSISVMKMNFLAVNGCRVSTINNDVLCISFSYTLYICYMWCGNEWHVFGVVTGDGYNRCCFNNFSFVLVVALLLSHSFGVLVSVSSVNTCFGFNLIEKNVEMQQRTEIQIKLAKSQLVWLVPFTATIAWKKKIDLFFFFLLE